MPKHRLDCMRAKEDKKFQHKCSYCLNACSCAEYFKNDFYCNDCVRISRMYPNGSTENLPKITLTKKGANALI